MTDQMLRRTESGIFITESANRNYCCRRDYTMYCVNMDIVIFRHQRLNFLIFLEKKLVQHHPKICISFLTRTEARWYFVRILLHLLQEVLQSTIPRMICR